MFLSSVAKLKIVAQTLPPDEVERSNDMKSIDNNSLRNDEKDAGIVFSNEAIELLRKCHGQFLSLVSSELASGERIEKKKKQKNYTSDFIYTDDDGPAIRSIVAQNVMTALENLDFHYISESLMDNSSHNRNGNEKKRGGDVRSKTKTNSKGKIKKRLKHSILTAELLEEQEKLLARSAARAKQSIGNA